MLAKLIFTKESSLCVTGLLFRLFKNMKPFRICILIIWCLISFASCTQEKTEILPEINFDKAVQSTSAEVFSELKVIPLIQEEGHFMSNIRRLEVYDDRFVLSDNRNVIHIYSRDGKFISNSEKKIGHGNGEYTIMIGFTYNPYSKYVEISTPAGIKFYDEKFNFICSASLPTNPATEDERCCFFEYLYGLSPTLHLLLPSSISENPYTISVYDSEREEIIKTIDVSEDIVTSFNMTDKCFSEIDANTKFFYPPGAAKYTYRFKQDDLSLEKGYSLNFGSRGLTPEDGKMSDDLLEKSDFVYPLHIYTESHKLFFLIRNGNDDYKRYYLVYDEKTGGAKKVYLFEDGTSVFPAITSVHNGCVYSVQAVERVPLYTNGFNSEVSMPDLSAIDDGSMCVLEYKIK